MNANNGNNIISGNLLFPKIFRTFHLSFRLSKLVIAFMAITLICFAGQLMDLSNSVVVSNEEKPVIKNIPGSRDPGYNELDIYISDPYKVDDFIDKYLQNGERSGVFSTLWNFSAKKFHHIINSMFAFNFTNVISAFSDLFAAIRWALKYHFMYCVIFFSFIFSALSIAGGAICRITALQFAKNEKPGLSEALHYSIARFKNLFIPPIIAILFMLSIAAVLYITGWVGRIPYAGELLVAILTPLIILAGALITIATIGTLAGFNLMFPAVAYENSDYFDVISKSFYYVFVNPWRMGFYTLLAAGYGAVCYVIVRFFLFLSLWSGQMFLKFGLFTKNSEKMTRIWPDPTFLNFMGGPANPANFCEKISAYFIHFCVLAVIGLLASFIISFFFSANTIIYALIRNKTDNVALDNVYTPTDDPQMPDEIE